jgi:hypothetical protein
MQRLCGFAVLLLLYACGGGGTSADLGPGGTSPDLSDVSVHVSGSPYAAVLKDCALAASEASLCRMDTLPLLGHDSSTPTVADVMDRVLVSHAWMGTRFEEVLNLLPADLLTLFKGVTAIVIDSDIRPSFYASRTAAIYLDPANLWLTNAEKATISKSADFRSDFGADLQFVSLRRYTKDNEYAYPSFSLSGSETRQLTDLIYPLARLLYHELAHANDFLPPDSQATLDPQLTPFAAIATLESSSAAVQLDATAPLTSLVWRDLAEVLFRGAPATSVQMAYSGSQVGDEFASDAASDTYGYASIREDVAMLFEETMMKYHFDVDRDIAFTIVPTVGSPVCDDYLVEWGVRNRLGAATVKSRAEQVAAALLPGTDLSGFFAGVPDPTPMTNNLGWCGNLTLGAVTTLGLEPARKIHPDQIRQDRLPPGDL